MARLARLTLRRAATEGALVEESTKQEAGAHWVLRFAERFKRAIAAVLLILMALLVVIITFELVIGIVSFVLPADAVKTAQALLSEDAFLEALGVFLTVLIALELIETVEVYFREHAVHVEIILLVGIIALARKFVILQPKEYSALTLAAMGFIVLSLGVTYFLVRRAGPPE